MKRFALYLGILAGIVASCSTKEVDSQILVQDDVVFYASFEQPIEAGTKVYANENLLLRWTADDRVSIFNKITYNQQYKFTGSSGASSGGFKVVDGDDFISGNTLSHVVSVYPYLESTEISETEALTVTLPAEQYYAGNSFGLGANTMVSVTSNNRLQYKNVCGYLVVKLYGDGVSVSSITLRGNNGEKLAGKATVTMPLEGVPTTTMAYDATSEITLTCATPVQLGATAEESTQFWFVVPPVTFSKGFTITVSGNGGVFEKTTGKTVTIERNYLSRMSPIEVVPDYDNVYVQFEDETFKAYCVENFDSDGDGEVSFAEAKAVNSIRVYKLGISSLKGIESFTNLTYLACSSNQLTSLDVSQNTELEELYCSSNQLTSLDVSKNIALTKMRCELNRLTSLDVRGCTALTYLYCYDNQLTSLDVSENTELEELHCYDNQMTSLDARGCTALTELECLSNRLTSLDVRGCTALTYLYCFDNQLTSLNVSQNTALTKLWCYSNQLTSLDVSQNPELEELYCSSNHLTSLDVSHNTALTELRCASNQLTSLDVSHNTALTELRCASNQLTSLDVSHNTALTELECSSNRLTSLDVSQNTALISLICSSTRLTSLDVSHNTELEALDCHFTQLTSLDVSHNTELEGLFCYSTRLTSLDVSHNTALTYLYCYSNQLTSLDVSHNTELEALDCHFTQLTSLDVSQNTALTYLWCYSTQLTSLDVSHNSSLNILACHRNPSLTEIWMKTGQTISDFSYDTDVATIKYKG